MDQGCQRERWSMTQKHILVKRANTSVDTSQNFFGRKNIGAGLNEPDFTIEAMREVARPRNTRL